MSVLRAVVLATTATALAPARTPLRRSTAAYTASLPSTVGEIYADAPAGLFGARPDPFLALEIPVVDETAQPKEEEEGLVLRPRPRDAAAGRLRAGCGRLGQDAVEGLAPLPLDVAAVVRVEAHREPARRRSSCGPPWWRPGTRVFRPFVKPLGTGMHTLVGGALSLLLVFRTNTAYNRFWDGRSIFGSVATAARDVVEFAGLYRREIGVQRADRISSLLKAFPIALQLHLQGFRFSPTSGGAPSAAEAKDAACVGEKEVLRLFRRMGGRDPALDGGAGEPTIRARRLPARAAAPARGRRGVGRADGSGGGASAGPAPPPEVRRAQRSRSRRRIARHWPAYYAPLDLWRALRRAGAETRDAVARSSNMPLAITTKIAQEIKGVAYAPDDSFERGCFTGSSASRISTQASSGSRVYLLKLKRVADLRSTIARAERIVQTPVPLHYARHTSRFLSVWCFTLPLCLAPTVPAVVLPVVVGLASWALLGLREIGLLIENPFRRSLQLTQCTDALGREIDETLALHR